MENVRNGREERMGVNKKWRIGKKREREEWERIENERNGREERTSRHWREERIGGFGEKIKREEWNSRENRRNGRAERKGGTINERHEKRQP